MKITIIQKALYNLFIPLVLQVVCGGGNRAVLGALEVSNAHSMSDVGVVDVSEVSIVAFLPDNLHGADHLILIHEGVEAELRELLGEVVGRNVH